MKLLDLIQELDGAGLVVADEQEIEAELDRMGWKDADVFSPTLRETCNSLLGEIEKWNEGKPFLFGDAYEKLGEILDA